MKQLLLSILTTSISFLYIIDESQAKAPLPDELAFPTQIINTVKTKNDITTNVVIDIAPHHYVYQERFKFQILDATKKTALSYNINPTFPKTESKFDEFNQKNVPIYHGKIIIPLKITAKIPKAAMILQVIRQGCSEAGICYPPKTLTFNLP